LNHNQVNNHFLPQLRPGVVVALLQFAVAG
jgi:hypothetical protein